MKENPLSVSPISEVNPQTSTSNVDVELTDIEEDNGNWKDLVIEDTKQDEGNNVVEDEYEDGNENDKEMAEPKAGMEFDDRDQLLLHYTAYAMQKGFQVVHRATKKQDGVLKYISMVCACYGKSRGNSIRSNPQHAKKMHCGAKLNAKLCSNGRWRVTSIVAEHNHELIPSGTRFCSWKRYIRFGLRRPLEMDSTVGSRLSTGLTSCTVEAKEPETLTSLDEDFGNVVGKGLKSCTVKAKEPETLTSLDEDFGNVVGKEKVSQLNMGDIGALLGFFSKMQLTNSTFFYLMDVGNDGRLKSTFWSDERCKAAYEEFGDVITFDTTYLMNNYDIPIVTFLGVNHHGQAIPLGFGLIWKEDAPTFSWLFQVWLAYMGGKVPGGIITDQEWTIKSAIEVVFPYSRHRWCLQHIMKKIQEKLQSHGSYGSIYSDLSAIVYGSLTPDEFEEGWKQMMESFQLDSNEYLHLLYDERRRWVPAFVKNSFWAGMSTIQEGVIIKMFLNGYVNSKTTLKFFLEQYEDALRSKVQKEKNEDLKSSNSCIPLISPYALEDQIQRVYTTAKFLEFQLEIKGLMCCGLSSTQECGSSLECDVREDLVIRGTRRRVHFKVLVNKFESKDSIEIKCSCRLFEFKGIVCRHSLTVLLDKNVERLPDKYILRRWQKDVRRRHTKVRVNYDDQAERNRYDKMGGLFDEIRDLAMYSQESCDIVMNSLSKLNEEIRGSKGSGQRGM